MTSASPWRCFDDLATRAHVDRTRVYATGISNGGMMAYRLGVEAPDRIAAIAPIEGALMVEVSALRRPMPLIVFHSVDDPWVPYGAARACMRGSLIWRPLIRRKAGLKKVDPDDRDRRLAVGFQIDTTQLRDSGVIYSSPSRASQELDSATKGPARCCHALEHRA